MKQNGSGFLAAGIAVGLLTGYLRAFSPMSFWGFSDLAGRYGFWIVTVSVIACVSEGRKRAAVNAFCYMAAMCVSYYSYLYFRRGVFYGKQFALWCAFSVAASVFAGWLCLAASSAEDGKNANDGNGAVDDSHRAPAPDKDLRLCKRRARGETVILVIPLALLGIECADMWYLFLKYRTDFLQLLIDSFGMALLFWLFTQNKDGAYKRKLLCLTVAVVAVVCAVFLALWNL